MKKATVIGYSAGAVGSALLGAITLPIITWFFPVEDIGRVSMLQVISTFCVLLFGLGLDQAYVREYHEVENKPALLRRALLPGLLLILFLFVCIFFYDVRFISVLMYDERSVLLSFLTAGCFVFFLISRFLSLVLRMQERAWAFSLSQFLPKFLFLCIVGGSVFIASPANIHILVGAQFLSALFVMLLLFLNSRHEIFGSANKRAAGAVRINSFSVMGCPW